MYLKIWDLTKDQIKQFISSQYDWNWVKVNSKVIVKSIMNTSIHTNNHHWEHHTIYIHHYLLSMVFKS